VKIVVDACEGSMTLLEQAVRAVFGKQPRHEQIAAKVPPAQRSQLQSALGDAQQVLPQGGWSAFGKAIELLEDALTTEEDREMR
jgi:hypothetical protein